MKYDFRVPHNTMSVCVREVCQAAQALIDEYKDECIATARTLNMLKVRAVTWRSDMRAVGTP